MPDDAKGGRTTIIAGLILLGTISPLSENDFRPVGEPDSCADTGIHQSASVEASAPTIQIHVDPSVAHLWLKEIRDGGPLRHGCLFQGKARA